MFSVQGGGKLTGMNDDQRQIAQFEHELAQAHVEMDLEKIDELLHGAYTILQPDGETENKERVLASYQTGTRHWHEAAVNDLSIAISGNLALVSGLWTAAGRNGGELFDYSARFLSMWRKDNGRWRNIAYQAMEISNDED
jgi:ketosteroid isomerase-like protein